MGQCTPLPSRPSTGKSQVAPPSQKADFAILETSPTPSLLVEVTSVTEREEKGNYVAP